MTNPVHGARLWQPGLTCYVIDFGEVGNCSMHPVRVLISFLVLRGALLMNDRRSERPARGGSQTNPAGKGFRIGQSLRPPEGKSGAAFSSPPNICFMKYPILSISNTHSAVTHYVPLWQIKSSASFQNLCLSCHGNLSSFLKEFSLIDRPLNRY